MQKPESALDSERQTDHPILARWGDQDLINKKKRSSHWENPAVPADHKVIIKENENR